MRALALAAVVALAAGLAAAQTVSDAPAVDPDHDRLHDPNAAYALIAECLASAEDASDCRSAAISACLAYAGNETTAGAYECGRAAAEAWRRLMMDYYAAAETLLLPNATENLGPTPAELAAAQEAWEAYAAAACGVEYDLYRGGTLAKVAGAECQRRLRAARALELKALSEAYF